MDFRYAKIRQRQDQDQQFKKLFKGHISVVKNYLVFKSSKQPDIGSSYQDVCSIFQWLDISMWLHEVYKSREKIYLVMNYASHGPLLEHLQKNPNLQESDIRLIMGQLLLALDFMHKKQIVHRDIKPDNILVMDKDNLQVCIADLGFSCSLNEPDVLQKKCGTPGYVGPEVLKGQKASTKSDIFSLGSLFYNLLAGQMLFGGRTAKQVLQNNQILDAQIIIDRDKLKVSKESLSLLKWMVHKDPYKRPSAEECLNKLSNSQFNQTMLHHASKLRIARSMIKLYKNLSSSHLQWLQIITEKDLHLDSNQSFLMKMKILLREEIVIKHSKNTVERHLIVPRIGIYAANQGLPKRVQTANALPKKESDKKSLFFKKKLAPADPNMLHVDSPLLPRKKKQQSSEEKDCKDEEIKLPLKLIELLEESKNYNEVEFEEYPEEDDIFIENITEKLKNLVEIKDILEKHNTLGSKNKSNNRKITRRIFQPQNSPVQISFTK
ncbi:serine threonine protein kinase [Stylonychia lemnae]|uniref:Serine threonine protein kinase n=1 Tax=Stylonychia lemnae TaxID=5949 RepID=A0A078AQL4_STYLE|nr:serine threonine protein kinase [Stylonychia lemnae]|eukprot:CDW83537.1 serine threonine protein kinase [Stylonychia lemnae]